MLAALVLCIVVAALTFFLVFKQGLFSSAILAFLSLASAMIAWNYFEALGNLLGNLGLSLYCPQTVSLLGLFVITLLIFREIFDRLIHGNMRFPILVDRIGSAFFGLIASMTIAGMIAVGFQLLPVQPTILGFDRCPELENPDQDNSLFPKADGFVTSLIGHNSRFGFAGKNSFKQYHPSPLREMYLNRVTMAEESRQEAGENCVTINSIRRIDAPPVKNVIENSPVNLQSDETCLAVSFSVKAGTDSKANRGAKDADGFIRCTMGNIRLVGFDPRDKSQAGKSAYPIGMLYPSQKSVFPQKLSDGRIIPADANVELLFAWPSDLKKCPPQFLEFKRTARAALPPLEEQPPSDADLAAVYTQIEKETSASLAPVGGEGAYRCEKMILVHHGAEQPSVEMELPSDEGISKAAKEKNLVVTKPEISDKEGYHQVHFMAAYQKSTAASGEFIGKGLLIPEGFTLICVRATDISLNAFFPPVVVDENNKRYETVGWTASSVVDMKDYVELVYDVKFAEQNAPFEDETIFKDEKIFKGKKVDRITAVFFYLLPNKKPVAVVGCSAVKSRSDNKGTFFVPKTSSGMMVVAPPQQ